MLTGCKSDGRVHDKNYLRAVGIDGETVTMAFFDGSQVTVDSSEPEKARKSAKILQILNFMHRKILKIIYNVVEIVDISDFFR